MSRFTSAAAQTFAVAILNRAIGIGVGIMLARYLGPLGRGYVAYAVICLELITTGMNGIGQAITHQYGAKGLPGDAVYKAMMGIVIGTTIPLAAVIAAIAYWVPSQSALYWVIPALPFAIYSQVATGFMFAADRVDATNVQRFILTSAGGLATVLALMVFGADYRLVLGVWALSYVVSAIYSWWIIHPLVSSRTAAQPGLVRAQLSFGGVAGLAQMAGYLNMRIDLVIVTALLGARLLGIYSVAVGVAELLWQLSSPLAFAAFPRIATAAEPEAARFTAKLVRHIFALVVPVAAILFVFAPWLITTVYGAPFSGAGGALRWILPGVVAYSVEIPLGYYLLVRLQRPGLILTIQLLSGVACAAITVLTAHTWGIRGAAFATSLTYGAVVLAKAWIFHANTGVGIGELTIVTREDIDDGKRLIRRLLARLVPARAA